MVIEAGLVIALIAGGAGTFIDQAAAAPGGGAGSGAPRPAAPSQAEIAAKLNQEGKDLMYAGKFAEASAKFRAAVARVPDPGYFLNLCTALFQEGKFSEALTACNAVSSTSPTADQRAKAQKLAVRIRDEAKAQGIKVEPAAPTAPPPAADPPKGPSHAEIAAKLNQEGKELMYASKFAEASARFRAAVARVPDPGYFLNLCTALFQEGKFSEALTACNAVSSTGPTADQRAKAQKLAARIRDEAKAQGIKAEPAGPPAADPPKGQSQAEIAAALNKEGKALLLDGKYAEAAARLRQAVARVPDPTYFFNLCVALFQGGKFGEALTACNAAAANNPTSELRAKIDRMIGQIRDEAKAQGISLAPP